MMMEAMRLSLLEHEKQQAKDEADKKKQAQTAPSDPSSDGPTPTTAASPGESSQTAVPGSTGTA